MISVFARLIIWITLLFLGFCAGQQYKVMPISFINNSSTLNKSINKNDKVVPLNDSRSNKLEKIIVIDKEVNNQIIKVDLKIDFGNGQIKKFDQFEIKKNSTVFDLLNKITTENNLEFRYSKSGSLGSFIESIDGVANNFKSQKFWQYWINGSYAKIGASGYRLKNQDMIEWKRSGQSR